MRALATTHEARSVDRGRAHGLFVAHSTVTATDCAFKWFFDRDEGALPSGCAVEVWSNTAEAARPPTKLELHGDCSFIRNDINLLASAWAPDGVDPAPLIVLKTRHSINFGPSAHWGQRGMVCARGKGKIASHYAGEDQKLLNTIRLGNDPQLD